MRRRPRRPTRRPAIHVARRRATRAIQLRRGDAGSTERWPPPFGTHARIAGWALSRHTLLDLFIAGTPSLHLLRGPSLRVAGVADLGRIEEVDDAEIGRRTSRGAWLASYDDHRLPSSRHAVPGARRWRRSHVLEGVPAAGADSERGQVTEVVSVFGPAAKHVHDVVDQAGGVALAGHWDIADAVELTPLVDCRIVAPYVVEPLIAVGTAKPVTDTLETVFPEGPRHWSRRHTGRACHCR